MCRASRSSCVVFNAVDRSSRGAPPIIGRLDRTSMFGSFLNLGSQWGPIIITIFKRQLFGIVPNYPSSFLKKLVLFFFSKYNSLKVKNTGGRSSSSLYIHMYIVYIYIFETFGTSQGKFANLSGSSPPPNSTSWEDGIR